MHRLSCAPIALLLGLLSGSYARADNSLVSVYQKQCDAGDAFYCQALGVALEKGDGVSVDRAGAAAAFVKACEGDAAVACRYAGDLYAAGDGVTRDAAKAAALYRRACDHHDAEACGKTGDVGMQRTNSAPGDAESAAQHSVRDSASPTTTEVTERQVRLGALKRNCMSGDGKSCRLLGDAYDTGEGWNRTSLQQAKLYQQACTLKDGIGCYKIGSLYKWGFAVPKDEVRARAAFEKGCVYGNEGACLMLPKHP